MYSIADDILLSVNRHCLIWEWIIIAESYVKENVNIFLEKLTRQMGGVRISFSRETETTVHMCVCVCL